MDLLGLSKTGAAPHQGQAKKARKGESESEKIKRLESLMLLVVKLSLSSAQAVRVLKSCTIDVYRLSSAECFVVKAMAALDQFISTSKSYEDKALQMEEIGLPHHHIFNSLMGTALEVFENQLKEPEAPEIKAYIGAMGKMDRKDMWNMWQSQVRHCKIVKAFDKKFKKLEVHIVQGTEALKLWNLVVQAMSIKDKSFKILAGIAPRGDLERKLQDYLEKGNCPLAQDMEDQDE